MVIRYRAWDKHVKKIRKVTEIHFDDNLIYLKANNGKGYYCSFSDIVLMQSTGLKDKNGVEIYERDIVKNNKGEIGRVVYLKQEAGFVVVLPKSDYRLGHRNTGEPYDMASGHEVISNIYANPELLSSGIE